MIFVFGSNRAGRHGKGAALAAAKKWGALNGQGEGHHGNSYAIPTKSFTLETLPIDEIRKSVNTFIKYVKENPQHKYYLTAIGCGLAGYKPREIAPLFKSLKDNKNIIWPKEFKSLLNS